MRSLSVIIGDDGAVTLPDGNKLGFGGEHMASSIDVTLPADMTDEDIAGYYLTVKTSLPSIFVSTRLQMSGGKLHYDFPRELMVSGPVTAQVKAVYESGGEVEKVVKSPLFMMAVERSIPDVTALSSEYVRDTIEEDFCAMMDELREVQQNQITGIGSVTAVPLENDDEPYVELGVNDKLLSFEFGIPSGADGVSPEVSVLENTELSYRLCITGASGSVETPNLKGAQGVPGQDGADGQDGVSPEVSVLENTDESYRLRITGASGNVDTPNLKGAQGVPGQDGADGQDGLTTSVNGVAQSGGNISLTLHDIPDSGDSRCMRLINSVALTSAVAQITIDETSGGLPFELKHMQANIFVPENSVPAGTTGTYLRAYVNGDTSQNAYTNNGSASENISLGQLRTGGSAAQVTLDSVGANGKFILVGISPCRSYYVSGGSVSLTAERYTTTTTYAGEGWEYIESFTVMSSSSSYPLPVGSVVELWGY